jgi:tetratricopeptide (TPR) repeat protein
MPDTGPLHANPGADRGPASRRRRVVVVVAVAYALAGLLVIASLLVEIAFQIGANRESSREFDAYGDSLAAAGDTGGAVIAYRRAFALVPLTEIDRKIIAIRLRELAENPDLLDPRTASDVAFDAEWLVHNPTAQHRGLALAVKGQVALLRGNIDAAEQAFEDTVWSRGYDDLATLGFAMVHLARGETAKARDAFAEAAAALPRSAYAQVVYGDLVRKDDLVKAEGAYVAAIKVRDTARAHRGLAKVFLARRENGAAIAELRKAVAMDGNDSESLGSLGSLLASEGDAEGATAALRASLKQRPDADLATTLSDVLLLLKRPAEAVELARPYLEDGTAAPLLRLNYARALELAGMADEAGKAYAGLSRILDDAGRQLDAATAGRIRREIEAGLARLGSR